MSYKLLPQDQFWIGSVWSSCHWHKFPVNISEIPKLTKFPLGISTQAVHPSVFMFVCLLGHLPQRRGAISAPGVSSRTAAIRRPPAASAGARSRARSAGSPPSARAPRRRWDAPAGTGETWTSRKTLDFITTAKLEVFLQSI